MSQVKNIIQNNNDSKQYNNKNSKIISPHYILYKCIEANVPIKEMLSRMYSTHYICIVAKLKL